MARTPAVWMTVESSAGRPTVRRASSERANRAGTPSSVGECSVSAPSTARVSARRRISLEASRSPMKPPRTVTMCPAAIHSSTWRTGSPMAAATSRDEYTSGVSGLLMLWRCHAKRLPGLPRRFSADFV